ncbi:MAG: NADH-quinone oxidoreductase subunit L [Anaerolineales bacterium]|nr:NADH-quinone oxidoreductase subunit L [Anaerolineales bacterium]MCW5855188.1 NADH-quinone oxidoreductase subunit L [Anaerolineales bacterium]
MTTETLIWLIPLPPLLAFFLILLFTRRNNALSHTVGVAAAAISWLLGMLVFIAALGVDHFGEHVFASAINWLPLADGFLSIGVMIDPLSAIVLFFVNWTVLMIFIYSIGYHNFGQPVGDHDHPGLPPHGAKDAKHPGHTVPSIEPMYARFFAFIALFAFGMYTLVVSDNLLTLFVGWEIMGLCSYLLIGFWYAKPSARDAAMKAFMTTRIGDVFMLLGIVALYAATGTLNFRDILYNAEVLDMLAHSPSFIGGLSLAGLISILLFIGTVGKSAQWPLHVWLPDAMEGPTPVSAMIHAATMVSAGIYMVLRMFPLISAGWHHGELTTAMTIMAFIGAFTALFAATIAVAQRDIKRVLAYSTISQLGYMIAALGIGAYVAAAFHLVTHAFFKALLFLGSGSVIHGVEHGVLHTGDHKVDPQDMFNMGGLKDKMPITFWTFLIGGLALSGFPLLTSGFWSKDEILADAFAHGHFAVFVVLALAALLTAFYTMRQITLTFLGKPRTKEAEHASENVPSMTVPLVVLSVFAVAAGWVGIPEHFPLIGGLLPNWFHHFLGGALLEHPSAVDFNWIPLIVSLVVALGGLGLGYLVYRNAGQTDPLRKALGPVYTLLENKYYFDELYQRIFVKPAQAFSENFSYRFLDGVVIDGLLHRAARGAMGLGLIFRNKFEGPVIDYAADLLARITQAAGRLLRIIQTGQVQQYLLWVALVVFGGFFYYLLNILQ